MLLASCWMDKSCSVEMPRRCPDVVFLLDVSASARSRLESRRMFDVVAELLDEQVFC